MVKIYLNHPVNRGKDLIKYHDNKMFYCRDVNVIMRKTNVWGRRKVRDSLIKITELPFPPKENLTGFQGMLDFQIHD